MTTITRLSDGQEITARYRTDGSNHSIECAETLTIGDVYLISPNLRARIMAPGPRFGYLNSYSCMVQPVNVWHCVVAFTDRFGRTHTASLSIPAESAERAETLLREAIGRDYDGCRFDSVTAEAEI